MDLNQLLYHHQMALMAVSRAKRDGDVLPNFDLPRYYAKRINEYREQRGLSDRAIHPADLPQTSAPPPQLDESYPAFIGDTIVAELLVNKALSMTEEERSEHDLNGLVEQLAKMQEELWAVGHDIYRALQFDQAMLTKLAADLLPPWAHERDACLSEFPLRPDDGIVHTYIEQFRVGEFCYTNIQDARAALSRQRTSARTIEDQANDS